MELFILSDLQQIPETGSLDFFCNVHCWGNYPCFKLPILEPVSYVSLPLLIDTHYQRGKCVQVKLPSGQIRSVNYNCTTVPFNGTFLPTIWFEASAAHGIVDFLGLQESLAVSHGRNSCSYDPPNFGWSDRLPSNLPNYLTYFRPLLDAIHKQDEAKIIVGWGGGGYNALKHAIEDTVTTKALVLLDTSPDGIEWFDLQRKNNWDGTHLQDYRTKDMAGRIRLAAIILSLGIPW